MKKLLTFLFFSLPYFATCQEVIECGSGEDVAQLTITSASKNAIAQMQNPEPLVFNIYFHLVKGDNGNWIPSPSDPNCCFNTNEPSIMQAVAFLNISYNPYNIYFKFLGWDEIHSDNYTALGTEYQALDNEYGRPDAIDVYVVDHFTNFGSFPPGAYVPSNPAYSTSIFFQHYGFSDAHYTNTTMLHEVGHVLNLKHVFENYNNANAERVTRDTNNPVYNADTHGDLVEDTPAQPKNPYATGNVDCAEPFDMTATNYYNEPYEDIIAGNFMSYTVNCNRHLSEGQIARIRESVQSNPDHYGPLMNTLASLYQPWEVTPIAGDHIVSVEEIPENTAMLKVCRNLLLRHRFQTGFNYQFPDCSWPDTIASTPYVIPVVKMETFDFPVIIQQISNEATEIVKVNCTRGVICAEEPIVGGVLISTQVLGSMNITVEELTKIQASDPSLFETLMSEYYYILKKMTETGVVKERYFYKP
ncbi:hypothetical protein FLLO111716_09085 [Flavobacterium longum]|uniref:M43 family zinc metalloprotease n=1 Tax=Flavobacterium longum TaxID=1299340 RepID=UPI0039EA92B4